MDAVIKPKALKFGMNVGIISTSHSLNASSPQTIARSYAYLESKGLHPIEADNCRNEIGHAAGTISQRANSTNNFFQDPNIDAIISFWGGYNTAQLLEHLDYKMIATNPKPLNGFSDLTSLQIALYSQIGLGAFSGPGGITFGKPQVPAYTWDSFERVLFIDDSTTKDLFCPILLEASKDYSENKWWEEENELMRFQKK